jgi:hypothetical protein
MLFSWIPRLFQSQRTPFRRICRSGQRPRLNAFRPTFECLESRVVPAFLAPAIYPTGVSPAAIAVGDFNNDGKQDIVTVSNTSIGSASVLLGNGNGTFQAPIYSPAGTAPNTVAVADFDGDGKLDLVVGGPAYLAILKGNGDGTFQAPLQIVGIATHISTPDLNNDGHPDLVATSIGGAGGAVETLMNHGDGTFAPPVFLSVGANDEDVKAADLNHDGNQDLVIANQSSGDMVTILMGNGDGTFQPARNYYGGSAPRRVELGDFDHDGNLDIVDLNSYSFASTSILMGNGDGTFQPPTTYGLNVSPNDLEVDDFNGDGNLDLFEPTGQGYEVEMGRGDGSFYTPIHYSALAVNGGQSATGDFNGDGSPDVATTVPGGSVSGSVAVYINANNGAATLAGATAMTISTPATAVAGQAFPVTVTAVDGNGNPATGFTGTIAISDSSQALAQPFSYTFSAADAGTHTFANPLYVNSAGVHTVTATSPFLPTASTQLTILPAAATRFTVAAPPSSTAGSSVNVTATAYDIYGNVATNYVGTVALSSSDVQAALPAAYGFTAADSGMHIFSATLKTAGPQTITARDSAKAISGTSTAIQVAPVAASTLRVTGGGGFVGSAHTVTVTGRDLYGNVATSYNGTIHLSSSDPNTTVSADIALTNGVGTFQVTPMTLGTQTLTATDTTSASLTGTETITVTPGWAARFTMTPLTSVVAGTSQSFTVTAYDAFGNVSTVYTGFVLVGASDPRAGSFYYGFTAADAGVHAFSMVLKTAGTQSISVTDYQNTAVAVKQSGIVVTPAAAAWLSVSTLQGTTAGVAQSLTVTAYDSYGNVATGYTGTVAFSSSDAQATLPAAYTFSAADAGQAAFSMAFKTSGGQSFSLQDTANAANPAFNSLQKDISISAAATAGFIFQVPSNLTAGVTFAATVSAVDTYGNVTTSYTGTVTFASSDLQAGLPANYNYSAAEGGKHTFGFLLKTAGTQSITAQDTVNAATASTPAGVLIKPAAASAFVASFPATTTAGAAQPFTVTAYDSYGNVATGYTGTLTFSSSDIQAGLPANYTFTNKDAGVHSFNATLKTAGTQSITFTDTLNTALSATLSGISVTASTTAGSFLVTGFPATTAGVAQSFTVTVRDALGNMATGYTGTVTFSSSDVQAGLPASYTFTAADAGAHTFMATLKTAGTQSLTVKDTAVATAVGSETGITVSASATVASLSVSGFPATTTGVAHSFTVTARDAFGNLSAGYIGTVALSSSDVQAGLPASYTFTAADAGVHTFTATLKTAGTQSLTVRDSATSSIVGSQTGIAVSAAAAVRFVMSLPTSVTQGVGFKFTVTVLDAYGNVATGYRGKVHLSSTDAKAGTSDYTFSSSDNGVHVFSFTFSTLGNQTLTIGDSSNGSLSGTAQVNVVAK